MYLCRYILLNYNLSKVYAFSKGASTYIIGLGYTCLCFKGRIGTEEALQEKEY